MKINFYGMEFRYLELLELKIALDPATIVAKKNGGQSSIVFIYLFTIKQAANGPFVGKKENYSTHVQYNGKKSVDYLEKSNWTCKTLEQLDR